MRAFATQGGLALLIGGLIFSPLSHGFSTEDPIPGSRYQAGRAAAMGGAYLPLARTGGGALMYNPAVLGRLRQPANEPMNFTLGASSGITAASGNPTGLLHLDSFKHSLKANPDTLPAVMGSVFPNFSTRGFGVGFLLQARHSAKYDSETGKVKAIVRYEAIPTIGAALRLFSGVIRLGYTLQWVNTTHGTVEYDFNDTMAYNKGLKQGAGFSNTVGVALSLPIFFLPSLNVVARNVLGTLYSDVTFLQLGQSTDGLPDKEEMSIDASASIQPKMGRRIWWNIVLQVRDLTRRVNQPFMSRASLGLELSFADFLMLRGGFGSGYPSAGIGFRKPGGSGELSLTYTQQEVGGCYRCESEAIGMIHYQVRVLGEKVAKDD